MRTALVALALWAGCSDDDFGTRLDGGATPTIDGSATPTVDASTDGSVDGSASASLDGSQANDLAPNGGACAPACGPCAAGEVCFGGALDAGFVASGAQCVKSCASSADCAAGLHCVLPAGVYGGVGAICAGDDTILPCNSLFADCVGPTLCADVHMLSRVYSSANGGLCGDELVACPTSCVGPTLDGGQNDLDGGSAHCL